MSEDLGRLVEAQKAELRRLRVDNERLVAAAAGARALLDRLTGRIEIDDRLCEECKAAEQRLWEALFPGMKEALAMHAIREELDAAQATGKKGAKP